MAGIITRFVLIALIYSIVIEFDAVFSDL